MRRLAAGTSGNGFEPAASPIDDLPNAWSAILEVLTCGQRLRPIQERAISESKVLETRQNLVVCAPTNSGKSLVGYLILLDAVLRGRRAVLLEPLRVLAQEQYEMLSDAMTLLSPRVFSKAPKVSLSTGDYRFEGELPADPPTREGEIVVATPERLDAILRNTDNTNWAASIGAVVLDEAHLLGDLRRGPTLELLVASMLSMRAPPRIALLSATVGEPQQLQQWLRPCQVLTSSERTPLHKEVWELSASDDPDGILAEEVSTILQDPTNAVIIFVYRRTTSEALALKLTDSLNSQAIAFHSGLSSAERSKIRSLFISGSCRCLVATTALSLGVNLPATHVLIRDATFFGVGRLDMHEILQILGRAGRGNRPGYGTVLVRPSDNWSAEELSCALTQEVLPPLRSSFQRSRLLSKRQHSSLTDDASLAAASLVATLLGRARPQGLDFPSLSERLTKTLAGEALTSRIHSAIRWLCEPTKLIAYEDEANVFHLTALGRRGVQSMLPLTYTASLGQLMRDLFSLDVNAKLLNRWSPLDHLFLVALLSERAPRARRFSEALAHQIDGWIEARPLEAKSMLFTQWVMGTKGASKADELVGSLGLINRGSAAAGSARSDAYLAMFAAILLDERSRGTSIEELERRWGVDSLEGLDEGWRDNAIWLLAGHASILELKSFYYHLHEHCSADVEQIANINHVLGRIRGQTYDLIEQLKYASPLGAMLRGLRASLRGTRSSVAGLGTIRKLEAAGVGTLQQVSRLKPADLENLGIASRFARQIIGYSRRRLR